MKKYKPLLIVVPIILAALHYSYEWRRQTSLLSELKSSILSSDELWLCNLDGYEITGECFKADKEKLAQALPQEIPNFSPGKAGAIHKYALKFFGENKAKCFLLIEYKDRADSIWISKIDTDPSCNSVLRQYGVKIPTIKNWFN